MLQIMSPVKQLLALLEPTSRVHSWRASLNIVLTGSASLGFLGIGKITGSLSHPAKGDWFPPDRRQRADHVAALDSPDNR